MSPQLRNLSIAPIRVFIARRNLGAILPLSNRSKVYIFYRPARIQYFVMAKTSPSSANFAKLNAFLHIAFDYYSLVEVSSSNGPGSEIPPAFRLDYLVAAFDRMKQAFAAMLEDLGNPPALTTLLEVDEVMHDFHVRGLFGADQGEELCRALGELEVRRQKKAELENEGRW